MSAAELLLVAQLSPTIDGMYWLLLTSRALHILGAIVLVGGLFYLRAVVTPTVVAGAVAPPDAQFGGRRATGAKWIIIATLFLLASGVFNYVYIINAHERLAGKYHMIVGIKILLSLALFVLAPLLAGRTSAAELLRQQMRIWLNVCLALGIAIVILGSVLRTFPRTQTPASAEPILAPANSVE